MVQRLPHPSKRKGGKQKNKSTKKAKKSENVNTVKEEDKRATEDVPKKGKAFNMVEDTGSSSAKIEEVEEITEVAIEWVDEENVTLGDHNVFSYTDMNPEIQMCNWLADSAMTSHVTNDQRVFMTYVETDKTMVTGIGGLRTNILERGTVE